MCAMMHHGQLSGIHNSVTVGNKPRFFWPFFSTINVHDGFHRTGRTGRVGHAGRATSFYDRGTDAAVAPELVSVLREVQQVVLFVTVGIFG